MDKKEKETVDIKKADDSLRKKIGPPGSIGELLTPEKIAAGQESIDDFKEGFFGNLRELSANFMLAQEADIDIEKLCEATKSLKAQSEALGFLFLTEISSSLYKFLHDKNPLTIGKPYTPNDMEKLIIRKHAEAILHAIKNQERGKGGMIEAEIVANLALLVSKFSK